MGSDKRTPAYGWGQQFLVPAGAQYDHPLLDPLQGFGYPADVADPTVGSFNDDANEVFVSQIMGQYQMFYSTIGATWVVTHRFWPGVAQDDSGTVEIFVPGSVTTAAVADSEIWYHRRQTIIDGVVTWFDTYSNPWWSNVDIRPRRLLEKHIVPTWSVFNPASEDILHVIQWFWVFGGNR